MRFSQLLYLLYLLFTAGLDAGAFPRQRGKQARNCAVPGWGFDKALLHHYLLPRTDAEIPEPSAP